MPCDYFAPQHDYKYFHFLSVIMLIVGYSYSVLWPNACMIIIFFELTKLTHTSLLFN